MHLIFDNLAFFLYNKSMSFTCLLVTYFPLSSSNSIFSMLISEILSSWKVSHTKSESYPIWSVGAAEKFCYKFKIRMPLFGSGSNIILIKPNKQLSFQELRSRLESSTKLLQDSIRIRETQRTTFQDCLVSSAWEEELEQKGKFKTKIPQICSTFVWRKTVAALVAAVAIAAKWSPFRTSWRPWKTLREVWWLTIAIWRVRRLASTCLSSLSW